MLGEVNGEACPLIGKNDAAGAVPGETWKICARPWAIMPQKVITVKSARSRCRKKGEPRDKWLTRSDAAN